jgi:hypothetical protein
MKHVQLLGKTGQFKTDRKAAISETYEAIYMYINAWSGITDED